MRYLLLFFITCCTPAFAQTSGEIDLGPNFFGGSSGGGGVSSLNSMTGAVNLLAGSNITITPGSGTLTIASTGGGGSGTVTSVAMTVPSFLSVAGSPITTNGTLAVSLTVEAANTVFAGPVSGGSATPAFRALVSADIPNNAANTTGTASNITASSNSTITTLSALSLPVAQLTGVLPIANGGTNSGTALTNGFAMVSIGGAIIEPTTSTPVAIGKSGSTAIQSINGGLQMTTRTITGSLTVDTTTTDYVIFCNQSGAITVTLPTPTVGRTIIVKDISGAAATNKITIAPHASESIEGLATSYIFQANYGSLTITSDGTNWWFI